LSQEEKEAGQKIYTDIGGTTDWQFSKMDYTAHSSYPFLENVISDDIKRRLLINRETKQS
jgi:hypothetical protein